MQTQRNNCDSVRRERSKSRGRTEEKSSRNSNRGSNSSRNTNRSISSSRPDKKREGEGREEEKTYRREQNEYKLQQPTRENNIEKKLREIERELEAANIMKSEEERLKKKEMK